MKRIFVAVDISDEARERAADHISILRRAYHDIRVGWERKEKLHLTMKFLGDTTDSDLEGLKKAMNIAAETSSSFRIAVGGTGVFPDPRSARILWLGVNDLSGGLAQLNANIEQESASTGFARETRNFKPHLTIGRLREPARSHELVRTHLETQFEPVELEVRFITIYESRLQPTGSIYSVNSTYDLKG